MITTDEHEILKKVLFAFGIQNADIVRFGPGLINNTFKITTAEKSFILQQINTNVFKQPQNIAFNIELIATHLRQNAPEYFFVHPLEFLNGKTFHTEGELFFRIMPFVKNSYTHETVQTPEQAYEAAKQFGRFTKLLSGVDASLLRTTIPHFHDLSLRYEAFMNACSKGNQNRRKEIRSVIDDLIGHNDIVKKYRMIGRDPSFKTRVTHHDTKISNVLFNSRGDGICVIDLDTVMPGFFFSDAGDMIRTYVSATSEEDTDFESIMPRKDFYQAIVNGYEEEMRDELTAMERKSFLLAGKIMICMQALRFLTDYLNNDVYYGARYEKHNLDRGVNQLTLLERIDMLEP